MKKRTQKISIFTFSILWLASMVLSPQVYAEQITVTGNGSESVNTVVVSETTQTKVEQTNEANVVNNVSTESKTGNNDASFNTTGNTMVQTGDAVQQTQVTNSMNTSVLNQSDCCKQQETNIHVSNNGAFSTNHVSVNNTNTTSVNVYQNANVVNNIESEANTGNNDASFNTDGDSVIKTGDIKAVTKVKNGSINLSYIKIPAKGNFSDRTVKIFGNGFGSWNTVDLDEDNDTYIQTVNVANVLNDLKQNYSTGDNKAKFNTDGDTAIITGDIAASTSIDNSPINVNKVEIDCECEKKEKVKEKEKEVPAAPVGGNVPPPSQVTPQGPGPAAPVVHLASVGPQLPVTGNNWLVLALFGNIMMLLLGAYLRLRSGRSPGALLAM